MNSEKDHYDTKKVEQNEVGFCNDPILFYTDGLGPCIGICIAWNGWAAILHSANICMDEADVIRTMIETAKKVIPAEEISRIRPILCGGDLEDTFDIGEEHAATVQKCRNKAVQILKNAGFGKPHICWSGPGETAAVVADLKIGKVYVEHDHEVVGRWNILRPAK